MQVGTYTPIMFPNVYDTHMQVSNLFRVQNTCILIGCIFVMSTGDLVSNKSLSKQSTFAFKVIILVVRAIDYSRSGYQTLCLYRRVRHCLVTDTNGNVMLLAHISCTSVTTKIFWIKSPDYCNRILKTTSSRNDTIVWWTLKNLVRCSLMETRHLLCSA